MNKLLEPMQPSLLKLLAVVLLILFITSCGGRTKELKNVIANSAVDSDNAKVEYSSSDIEMEEKYSDLTELTSIDAFNAFKLQIPSFLKLTQSSTTQGLSNITFVSPSGKISIVLRHQTYLPLIELKDMFGSNNERNFRSEIININGIEAYVLDRKGTTLQEEADELRIWFFLGKEAYSVLLIFPETNFETTKSLRSQIVNSLVQK